MTLKELSQLYHLKGEIRDIKSRISELKELSTDTSAKITGMPHSGRKKDKIGSIVAEIEYYKSILKKRLKEYTAELIRLNNYISACPDSLTRQILEYRFIDGMSWNQVAAHIGITEASAKMIAYRYIKEN